MNGAHALERPHVENPSHMLVHDADGRSRLTREARDGFPDCFEKLWQEKLDGDQRVELQVVGGHHVSHSALAKDAIDAVLAGQNLARCHGHGHRLTCLQAGTLHLTSITP